MSDFKMGNFAKPYLMEDSLVAVGTKNGTFLGMVDSDYEFVQIYIDNIFGNGQYIEYRHVEVFEPINDVFLENHAPFQQDRVLIEPIIYGDCTMNTFFLHNKPVVLVGPARENEFIKYCHRALTFFGFDSILPLSASANELMVCPSNCVPYFKGINTRRLHKIEDTRIDNAGFVLCASTTPVGTNTRREIDYAMEKEIPGFDLSTFTAAKNKILNETPTLDKEAALAHDSFLRLKGEETQND